MYNMNDLLRYKLVKYHHKYSIDSNDNKTFVYQNKLKYYDEALSFQYGGVGNTGTKRYIALNLNQQVYQILNVQRGTLNIGGIFKHHNINQKSSRHSHITLLTFEICDGIVDSGMQFNINTPIDLTYSGLAVLPAEEPKFVVANYSVSIRSLLNITNYLEQELVNKIIKHLKKPLIKVRIEPNNIIVYAYDINEGDNIKKAINTNQRYSIERNKIKIMQSGGSCDCKRLTTPHVPINTDVTNPLEYLIPTLINFTTTPTNALHRYYVINNNQYKEVLTVHHYAAPNKGIVHTSLSNNRNNELNTTSNIKGLYDSLQSQMATYGTIPNPIHKDSLELTVL